MSNILSYLALVLFFQKITANSFFYFLVFHMERLVTALLWNMHEYRQTILFYVALWFFCGFLYRWIARKLFSGSVRGVKKNIQYFWRLERALIWVLLLLVTLTTSMSPWLLFFAGFCFFEAMFSRCGFYAAIGKNTCPLE